MPVICLYLTLAEARALRYAAGNSMDHADIVENLFPRPATRDAALRAYYRLQDAERTAQRKKTP